MFTREHIFVCFILKKKKKKKKKTKKLATYLIALVDIAAYLYDDEL
jgi:hypothetical protein